jgi:peptide deformylase
MRGYVERRARIQYTGFDQFGLLIEREAEGFHAVVFQHEYDHLDGILYTDRLSDPKMFGFVDELAAAEMDD